jgi:hypothetical protein
MYENLKSLGIQEPTSVDSYTLRQEANHRQGVRTRVR